MEVVCVIVGPVVKVLTVIKQKLGNLTSSADRVKEMKEKMKVLDGQRIDNEKHLRSNHEYNREIPARVPGWLEEVEMIMEEVEKFLSNDIGCFNVKKKYLAGRNALRLIKDIERLIQESSEMKWSDAVIPLGIVDSKRPPSTSGVSVFNSRVKTFNDALKLLQQDDDDMARVIALCGMGGVGKTTLMKQLKEAVHDPNMFNWIVVVVIGNNPNLPAIQRAIAVQTGEPLIETNETLRATYLSKRFKEFLERKHKILVILDDVWETIKLEDIGLASPLPKGIKLLLTSRDESICRQIAVDADSLLKVVKVDVLEEEEARDFFCQITNISAEHDRDLYEIGCRIVKKCGRLPLAIKLIAGTLQCQKEKYVWRRTLERLNNNDFDKSVQEIIEESYKNLKREEDIIETIYKNLKREEDKAIFLLCGMFPKDSNIPIEDLTRYAWGLKLLQQVSTMEAARDSIKTSVSNLKEAKLLMDGDSHHSDFVKLHNLVLEFVVNTVSKGGEEGCWIIHHEDDFSKLSEANNTNQSCKRISLTCKGVSEFPSEFKFPNLRFLKLVQGDESLRFPRGFYEGMKELQVIAFDKLALVPTSVPFSDNLRTLCLHECSLINLTCIGNLSNLEVLSFANSRVAILPSTFGNLKKLRLLDVTGCDYNLVIEDGVLESLVKLEELYMIPYDEETICCFTENNIREFAERSHNLKRFKLSVGCSSTQVREHVQTYKVDMHSYENSLKLVTKTEELLESKINELFKITYALYLQVKDMNTLEDVVVDPPHPPQNSSFYNLRLLVVSQCAELTYLFTPIVATNLSKLEYLDISGCPNMEAVIHTANEGLDIIMFSNLKYLRLAKLPKLLHFCNSVDVIEMSCLMELQLEGLQKFTSIYPDSATSFVSSNISSTQSFLNKEDATPKLEKLFVKDCDSIKVLFNMDFREIEQFSSGLRSIKVDGCNSLEKLFSCNPFPFFNNLQELDVRRCHSIQVLFEIGSGRAGRYEEQDATPKLEKLFVSDMENLKEIWPPRFSSSKLPKLKILKIERCNRLEHIFTFSTLESLTQLEELEVKDCKAMEVIVMEENGQQTTASEQDAIPKLEKLFVSDMENLKEIWPPRFSSSKLPKPKILKIESCNRLEHIFTFSTLESLTQLEELEVKDCKAMEVIVMEENGQQTTASNVVVFPHLKSIKLIQLSKFVGLCLGKNKILWPALEKVVISECPQIVLNVALKCDDHLA